VSSNPDTAVEVRGGGGTKHDQKELHIAPMLDVSTREFRKFFRILSKRAVLWTEMVVDETIIHTKDLDFHLGFDPETQPIICQIGATHQSFVGNRLESSKSLATFLRI
jgi:tRNA-dihydrouridine synthase